MRMSLKARMLGGGTQQNWTERVHIYKSLLPFNLPPPSRFNVADLEQIALVDQLLCRNWLVFMNKGLIMHLVKLAKTSF
jgi:hypothetical protein